ncbi:MAG: hypothetical protein IT548_15710 [Alphaproteobacteria bacterium]|nr:hypothetical protein [Alphaproteobacteria bacterium]
MTRMRALLLAGCLGTAVGSAAEPARYPDETTIRLIESQMVMPKGADPLEQYDRYYFFPESGRYAREIVEGRYVLRDGHAALREGAVAIPAVPGAYVVRDGQEPVIADGGCGVVTIVFLIEARRLARLKEEGEEPGQYGVCNGR